MDVRFTQNATDHTTGECRVLLGQAKKMRAVWDAQPRDKNFKRQKSLQYMTIMEETKIKNIKVTSIHSWERSNKSKRVSIRHYNNKRQQAEKERFVTKLKRVRG